MAFYLKIHESIGKIQDVFAKLFYFFLQAFFFGIAMIERTIDVTPDFTPLFSIFEPADEEIRALPGQSMEERVITGAHGAAKSSLRPIVFLRREQEPRGLDQITRFQTSAS